LLNQYRQPHTPDYDREQIARARQAAEALFAAKTPKPPANSAAVPEAAPAEQAVRKPRVLQIRTSAPVERSQVTETPPVGGAYAVQRELPRSEFARIRTLVK
jgi:hypothetical protein